MDLTRKDANRIIEGAIARAEELKLRVSVTVCDSGGRLLAFLRFVCTKWGRVYGSQGKAFASAAFQVPSGDMTGRADHPILRGIVAAEGGHMILGQGGVPIFRDGACIGACGVGGASSQEDEDCVNAGVAGL